MEMVAPFMKAASIGGGEEEIHPVAISSSLPGRPIGWRAGDQNPPWLSRGWRTPEFFRAREGVSMVPGQTQLTDVFSDIVRSHGLG